jgi:dTDP-4-amino-4,6-dideoxygalactose transaminase
MINDPTLIDQAYIYRDKGTNRHLFETGHASYYTWVGAGSNHTLSEIQAAILWAQLEAAQLTTTTRLDAWHHYYDAFTALAHPLITLPTTPDGCHHNGHIFALRLANSQLRNALIAYLQEQHIGAVFHYIPLHTSPAYAAICQTPPSLPVTEHAQGAIIRLPIWAGIKDWQDRVIDHVSEWLTAQTFK